MVRGEACWAHPEWAMAQVDAGLGRTLALTDLGAA
jgi:hypothetical protein